MADEVKPGAMPREGGQSPELGRRQFVKSTTGAAALGVLAGWTPVFRIAAGQLEATCPVPPNFPLGIPLYQQAFENWCKAIRIEAVWTCAPVSPADVVTICNWAMVHGYKVRPRGMMHNWSPLTLAPGDTCPLRVILLDTTSHLTAMSVHTATQPATVTAQAGVTMETLLTNLERHGLGITNCPAPGDLTLGGVLAIGGHGTSIPANGESRPIGMTYGSISNLVLSLTAVVYDQAARRYVLKTFSRSDQESKSFLVHVGRAFIVEATLQAGANQNLRCRSYLNIPASELFAPGGSGGQTMASFLDSAGRIEAIWFPFTSTPWLKVWSVEPTRPFSSRRVSNPYNYTFSDNIPESVSNMMAQIISGAAWMTPAFGQLQLSIAQTGIFLTATYDIWGPSKNLLLYVRPTTLRFTANGYAVHTSRTGVQQVINDFVTVYQNKVMAYAARGLYPMNGPVEIRISGLDQPTDVAAAGAGSPQLSALRPYLDHPEWTAAVWFDILTFPITPASNQFYAEMEQWMIQRYTGQYAAMRVEWSKGWAYTNDTGWANSTIIDSTIPNTLRAGQTPNDNWDTAVAMLDYYDPFRLFSSPLTDRLMP